MSAMQSATSSAQSSRCAHSSGRSFAAATSSRTAATNHFHHLQRDAQSYAKRNTQTTSPPSRMLTDFSIDSIIGVARSPISSPRSQPAQLQDQRYDSSYRPIEVPMAPADVYSPPAESRSPKKFRPKNFQCPSCKMAFSNNGQLKNHVRIHTGERPFICNFVDCQKTFTRNEELTRHKMIHTGVKPHVCSHCAKQFGRKDHLKKHIRTHERKRAKKVFLQTSRSVSSADQSFLDKSDVQMIATRQKCTDAINISCDTKFDSPIKTATEMAVVSRGIRVASVDHKDQCFIEPELSTILPRIPMIPNSTLPSRVSHLPGQSLSPVITQASSHMTNFSPTNNVITNGAANPEHPIIQQIARDYWQKWLDFVRFYQNPHAILYPPVSEGATMNNP